MKISIDKIIVDDVRGYSIEELSEFAETMNHFTVSPVVVTEIDGEYHLVSGNKRLAAAKFAGHEYIEADVKYISKKRNYTNRVELHCHTGFSKMDATASVRDIVKFAVGEGMTSVAFTDHGNVMAYPEIQKYSEREYGFKPIYGIEGYVVNDIDMLGKNLEDVSDLNIDTDVVAIDLETTGFSPENNEIIELGAVRIHNGEITDKFQAFVKPSSAIPEKIAELTGIDNAMVEDADSISVVLPKFLEFIGDSIIVAHNVSFDISFVEVNSKKLGINSDYKTIDTWSLSKMLLPELESHSLCSVAKAYDINLGNHHRANDDAATAAIIYIKMVEDLKEMGLKTIGDVLNKISADENVIKKSRALHVTILAKNMAGVKAIYRMVSDSNLKYNYIRPKIRLSELLSLRENLLLGSACSVGMLFMAIADGKSNEYIEKTASMFDFLEVQPAGENLYMISSKHYENINCVDDLIDINKRIIELGDKLNIPVVATSDVHYLRPENSIGRCILKEQLGLDNPTSEDNLHFRTTEEMLDEFRYLDNSKAYEIVVENTNKIAEQIEYIRPLETKKVIYHHEDDNKRLEALIREKLWYIYGDSDSVLGSLTEIFDYVPLDIRNRVLTELFSITDNKTAYYYLWFYDMLKNNKLHPSQYNLRGTAASMYICYLLGISHIDPMDDDTPLHPAFFMGMDGNKRPDIDMNFDDAVWGDVIESAKSLNNIKTAYRAATIITLSDDNIKKFIDDYVAIASKPLFDYEKSMVYDDLSHVVCGRGMHPGGMIMIPEGINELDYSPLDVDEESGNIILQFEYHDIDHIFDKIDILRHDNCTLNARLYAETGYYPTDVDIRSEEIMSLVTDTDCALVPGLSEDFTRMLIDKLKPKSFSELVKVKGISYGTNTWLENGEVLFDAGKSTIDTLIGTRDDVFEEMRAHYIDPGISYEIAEVVRKGRFKSRPLYVEAAIKADVPDWYIWSCEQVKYLFPRAHAAEYVQMELRSLFYKIHYPEIYKEVFSTIEFE